MPSLCRRHGEDAGAGAHIENAVRPRAATATSRQPRVVACSPVPNACRGIDLERDAARRNAALEMRAMNEEASD